MIRYRFTKALFVVLLLGVAPLLTTSAQELAATPVPGSAPTGVLAEFEIDALPTPHAEVWFLRMTLDADGTIPLGEQVGPTVLYVESGQLTLKADGTITRGAKEEPATGEGMSEMLLDAGDSVMIAEGTSISARNATGEPATFLALLMYAAEREGEEGPSEEPVGLTQQGISIGVAEFFPIPATVTIERVVLEPAGTMTSAIEIPDGVWPGWMGIELGGVETGSAEVVFESRTLQALTWPPLATDTPVMPEQVPLTATVHLGESEGYSAFNSTLSWTSVGDQPLTVLRVVVTPHMLGP